MTRILILLVAGSACALLPRTAVDAGCHAVHVQKQAVVAYQPVYGQQYLYQVGTGLQLRAAIEVAKEELRAEMRAMNSPGNSESSPERLPLTASGDPYSLVNKYCVGCHSTNAKASEAFDMSSLATLTCDERLVAINAVLDGRMPKGTKIPQELIGDLLGQLSQADTAPNASARVAAPKREQLESPPPEPASAQDVPAAEQHYGIPPTTGIGGPEVSDVSFGDVSDASVTLAWNAPEDAFVRVELMAAGGRKPGYNNYDAQSPLSITGLESGVTYVYLVQAKDSTGKVGTAASGKFTTK